MKMGISDVLVSDEGRPMLVRATRWCDEKEVVAVHHTRFIAASTKAKRSSDWTMSYATFSEPGCDGY